MPEYYSPGAAATGAVENFLLRREATARQTKQDQIALEEHQTRQRAAEKLLERQEREEEFKREDRERSKTEKEVEGMVIGDVPGDDLLVRARKHRIPMRTAVEPPVPTAPVTAAIDPVLGDETPAPVAPMQAGGIRFAGSPAQVKEQEAKTAQEKFHASLPPGSPQAQAASARMAGMPMSVGDFEPPAGATAVQEYNLHVQQAKAAGKPALSFDDWQARDANLKRPVVQPNTDAGYSPRQTVTFNQIAGAYEKSPLVKASDRTVILKDAAKAIREDPSNPSNQLNLAYSYIQVMDTYQSAVREGELKNLGALGTRLQQFEVQMNKVASTGAFLHPDVAKQIAESAERLSGIIEVARQRKMKEFASRAKVSGVGKMWDEFVGGFEIPDEPGKGPATGGGAGAPGEDLGKDF